MVMFAVGIWLVPALGGDRLDPGHSIVGLWLIGSATSLAAIGLALCVAVCVRTTLQATRSEEHTSELQSLMRISYAVFCLKKKTNNQMITSIQKKGTRTQNHIHNIQ